MTARNGPERKVEMSYDDGIRDEVFEQLGAYVRWWYELDAMKGTLNGLLDDAIVAFNIIDAGEGSDRPSEADKVAYESFSAEVHRQQNALESLRCGVAGLVSGFLGLNVKDLLDAPCTSPNDLLDHLIDLMDDHDDRAEANTVARSAVTEDEDNSVGSSDTGFSLPALDAPTQFARDDVFSLACSDDATVDGEQWTLHSGRRGPFSGRIATGTEVDWEAAGISGLLVSAAPGRDAQGDAAAVAKVGGWALAGAVRGTHVAADGRAWVRFNAQQSFAVENDELAQASGWNLDDLVFGEDTDVDGKVYVSVVKAPSVCEVLGGTRASLDASSIVIDGADETNTADGTLYVKVSQVFNSDDTRDFTIELHRVASRDQLEASGSVENVADEDLPVEIALEAQSGGVSARITLSAFRSTQDETDATILIKVPRYRVRVYRSSGRSEEDLYAEGVSYVPSTGSVALDLYRPGGAGSSYDAGDVTLNYIQDNETIELTVDFFTVDLLKADPDAGATDGGIVRVAGGPYRE